MQPPFFYYNLVRRPVFDGQAIAIFRYFVIIILYCKTIHPVIFFQQHTFFIVYILLYNTILNWFLLTLQSINHWILIFFSDVEHFPPELHPLVSILLLLYFKKNNTINIDDFSLLIQKKNLQQNKVYCKQNRHFNRDFFLGIPDFFNFILV